MSTAPYEQTFRLRGELCFRASIPALAHIGKRFDQLGEESFRYQAPAGEQNQWSQLVQRLEWLKDHGNISQTQVWPELSQHLDREFPDTFAQARGRVNRYVQEYFDTGQMPLAEYLEWIIHSAETIWSLSGGQGLDMENFQRRVDRLNQRLQTSDYESEMDRRLKNEDPQRYEFLSNSMQLLMKSMNDPDPKAHERMIDAQMELFRKSPYFEQARQSMEQMRNQIESLRDTHPELYEQQIKGFDQAERFWKDPTGAMKYGADDASEKSLDLPSADDLEEGDEHEGDQPEIDFDALEELVEEVQSIPPGQLLFNCGKRDRVSDPQIDLFQQFVDRQDALRPQVEQALREMHRWMHPGKPFSWPGDQLLFPDNPDVTDVPLQCFRIQEVSLDSNHSGNILLILDSHFGHFDEHGCYLRIRDGVVDRYGTWDDVLSDA